MPDIDLTSNEPLPTSPNAVPSFAELMARARGTVAAQQADRADRRAKKLPDPDGSRAILEDRIRYRQTFVKLRYVLAIDQTDCLCGATYQEPQGLYEESQSSKGGAMNLALVAATPNATLPKVVRVRRHQAAICAACAVERHGFVLEAS